MQHLLLLNLLHAMNSCVQYLASGKKIFIAPTTAFSISLTSILLWLQIQFDRSELQDARWFDATEVAEALKRKMPRKEEMVSFWIPPPWALAHHLIKEWTQKQ